LNPRTLERYTIPGPAGALEVALNVPAQPLSAQHPIPTETPGQNPAVLFRPGDIVRHRSFGEGRVTRVIKQAKDFHVIVVFDNYGVKTFLGSLAALEKIT